MCRRVSLQNSWCLGVGESCLQEQHKQGVRPARQPGHLRTTEAGGGGAPGKWSGHPGSYTLLSRSTPAVRGAAGPDGPGLTFAWRVAWPASPTALL